MRLVDASSFGSVTFVFVISYLFFSIKIVHTSSVVHIFCESSKLYSAPLYSLVFPIILTMILCCRQNLLLDTLIVPKVSRMLKRRTKTYHRLKFVNFVVSLSLYKVNAVPHSELWHRFLRLEFNIFNVHDSMEGKQRPRS